MSSINRSSSSRPPMVSPENPQTSQPPAQIGPRAIRPEENDNSQLALGREATLHSNNTNTSTSHISSSSRGMTNRRLSQETLISNNNSHEQVAADINEASRVGREELIPGCNNLSQEDIDYVLYAMPVSKDKEGQQTTFLDPLINRGIISRDRIFKPLENDALQEKLVALGFRPERPGVYLHRSYKGTIEVSTRTTREGDTEWNLFFKGVNLSLTRLTTLSNALQNASGIRKTREIANYKAVRSIVESFIKVAESTRRENNCNIKLTLAGHSMGGGLAETGLAAFPREIDKVFLFQSMDTKDDNVVNTIISNEEIALKLRDFHVKNDPLTGKQKN